MDRQCRQLWLGNATKAVFLAATVMANAATTLLWLRSLWVQDVVQWDTATVITTDGGPEESRNAALVAKMVEGTISRLERRSLKAVSEGGGLLIGWHWQSCDSINLSHPSMEDLRFAASLPSGCKQDIASTWTRHTTYPKLGSLGGWLGPFRGGRELDSAVPQTEKEFQF